MGERDGGREGEQARGQGGQEAQPSPGGSLEETTQAMRFAAARRRRQRRHEFLRLTGVDPTDSSRLVVWQIEHGIEPTGKFGEKDLEAARKSPKAASAPAAATGPASSAVPSEPEAPTPSSDAASATAATKNEFAGAHGDALVDEITSGATHEEKVDNDDLNTHLTGAGATVIEIGEAAHLLGGKEAPWTRLAMTPAVLNLLRTGRYSEAAVLLAKQLKAEELYEALLYATKHLGLQVASEWLESIAYALPPAEAMKEVILWTYDGLEAIRKAHEQGDRDNRIRLYGRGFAEGFLWGEAGEGKAILSAVTSEEVEAVRFGLADGSKTAGRTGSLAADIGRELLRRCGDADGVKRAILDALGKKAGLPGVWSK